MKIDDFLTRSGVTINNALNNREILDVMNDFGYNSKALQSAKALQEETTSLHQLQKKEYGEQYEASEDLSLQLKKVKKLYMRHVKLSRIAFKSNLDAQTALLLGGRRKASFSGMINQMSTYYNNLSNNAAWVKISASVNIKKTDIEAQKKALQDLIKANEMHKVEKGEAQKATEMRDEKLDELEDWYSDFVGIAEVAFEDDPQQLEKLGIVA